MRDIQRHRQVCAREYSTPGTTNQSSVHGHVTVVSSAQGQFSHNRQWEREMSQTLQGAPELVLHQQSPLPHPPTHPGPLSEATTLIVTPKNNLPSE
jgi:hypothetical protein